MEEIKAVKEMEGKALVMVSHKTEIGQRIKTGRKTEIKGKIETGIGTGTEIEVKIEIEIGTQTTEKIVEKTGMHHHIKETGARIEIRIENMTETKGETKIGARIETGTRIGIETETKRDMVLGE